MLGTLMVFYALGLTAKPFLLALRWQVFSLVLELICSVYFMVTH